MSTKAQMMAKAKKHNCQVNLVRSEDDFIVELDAWNQIFDGWGSGHGMTASGETLSEAYSDAINLMTYLKPCLDQNCNDEFHQ